MFNNKVLTYIATGKLSDGTEVYATVDLNEFMLASSDQDIWVYYQGSDVEESAEQVISGPKAVKKKDVMWENIQPIE